MIDNAAVYRAMTAIQKASYGDIEPTFEEMKTALEAAMKQDEQTIWTDPKIKVEQPLRFCSDCKYQQYGANVEPCNDCLKDTKGSAWQPK